MPSFARFVSSLRSARHAPVGPLPARRGGLTRAAILGFLLGVSTGCYNYVPVAQTTVPGSNVQIEVNDRGRIALGDALGASVKTVEGRVQTRSDTLLTLRLSGVRYINGTDTKWSGEPVSIRTEYVSQARVRQLSRSKTALVSIIAGGALIAFIVTRSILGGGTPQAEVVVPPGGGSQQ